MGENVTVGESVGENVTVGSAVVGISVVGAGLGAGVGENVLTESEVRFRAARRTSRFSLSRNSGPQRPMRPGLSDT